MEPTALLLLDAISTPRGEATSSGCAHRSRVARHEPSEERGDAVASVEQTSAAAAAAAAASGARCVGSSWHAVPRGPWPCGRRDEPRRGHPRGGNSRRRLAMGEL
ncbi:unnamed protein product [Lampetra fluviatilis]